MTIVAAHRRFSGGRLVIASHNPGKVREIGALLAPFGVETVSAGALGLPEPEETGDSFEANAELKALASARASALPALADDSGLVVAALGGQPGIYSARWAGPEKDFATAMRRVEDGLAGQADRRAHFVAVLSLAWPDGHVESFRGEAHGRLVWPPRGARGFGYDPMFLHAGHDLTYGEMEPEEKHRISHRAEAFGVYVHWPFCVSKCPYCDFNSHVRATVDETGWRAALLRDLETQARPFAGRTVDSVFFGGGTPSLMAPATVAAVIDRIATLFTLAEDVEITLEANPNSAEVARFRDLRAAGVGRVSIGVQALDDAALRLLGRAHGADEARRAIDAAAGTFARHSFDLIYARPGQDLCSWTRELDAALALAGEHLSVYQLTFEPGTRFEQLRRRGDIVPLDDATADAMFEATRDILAARGLPAYEISNHARPGAESRHNLGYWRYEDYLGLGPGAHGRLTIDAIRYATRGERAPETWMARVAAQGDGIAERDAIAPGDAAREALLMGLRLTAGVSPARFRRVAGVPLEAALDGRGLARALEGGFVRRTRDGGLAATPAGQRVLDAVLAEIAR